MAAVPIRGSPQDDTGDRKCCQPIHDEQSGLPVTVRAFAVTAECLSLHALEFSFESRESWECVVLSSGFPPDSGLAPPSHLAHSI